MMSFRSNAMAVGVIASLAACMSASAGASNAANTATPRSLPFEVLHNGTNSGYTRLSEFVIRDADEYTRRWRGVLQGSPDAVRPEINFEKTTVVFVAIGARNTGGYTVHVDSLTKESKGLTVHYTVKSPGSRCMSLQELTSPVEVISFDHLEGEVKFKKKNISGAC